jgi:hypothetical protein
LIPDGTQVEIQREKNLTSDNTVKITLSFEVQTYYPAYRKPNLRDLENGRFFGNYTWSSVNSSLSNRYNDNGPDSGSTDIITYPKRTKWYVNLREVTGRGAPRSSNENTDNDVNSQQ